MELTKEVLQNKLAELNNVRTKHVEEARNHSRMIDICDGAIQFCQELIYEMEGVEVKPSEESPTVVNGEKIMETTSMPP